MGYFVRKLEELPVSKVEGAHGGTGVLEVVQLLGNQEGVGFPGNPDDFESDVNFLHRLVLPQILQVICNIKLTGRMTNLTVARKFSIYI